MKKFLVFIFLLCGVVSIALAADCLTDDEDYYKSAKYKAYKERSAQAANPHKNLTGYTGAQFCEKCHAGAIEEVMNTTHYKWSGPAPANYLKDKDGKYVVGAVDVGKKHKIGDLPNTYPMANYLGMIPDKEGKPVKLGCGKCHPGSGYLPTSYEEAGEDQRNAVECLLCHSAIYDMKARQIIKSPDGKGFKTMNLKGEKVVLKIKTDMSDKALQSVGRPTVEACMRCHYHTGGGPLFKRGVDYASDTDVHAAKGLLCVDCHTPKPRKDHGLLRGPGLVHWNYDHYMDEQSCVRCHSGKVHKEARYDADGEGRVACVTCHIKTTGGLMERDFGNFKQSPKTGFYLFKSVVKDEHSQPVVFSWWDETANPEHIPEGSFQDGKSKLYIFKTYKQRLPVDKEGNRLATKNGLIFKKGPGSDNNGNGFPDIYEKAVLVAQKQGRFIGNKMENPGLKKSPLAGFKEHTSFIEVSHGVLPKEEALKCVDCHGPNPVLDWKALGMINPKVMN